MLDRASGTPGLIYAPDLGALGSEVALSPAESHYVSRVCRARPGETVEATDGRGRIAALRLITRRASTVAAVESLREVGRDRRVWLATGRPDGQRDDWLVEKLAEIGVERWIPVSCERDGWKDAARRRSRWERMAVAALKQSRSAFLMEIASPAPLAEVVECLPAGRRWLASQNGRTDEPGAGGPLVVGLVGPAAGLTPGEESALVGAGFQPLRLAENRLRTETAAALLAGRLVGAGNG